ncbi:type II toxin-antitoxin system ParD family antitoxin [Photorhabdus asymbiotica]|uniref:type II toxin-antitoxin system ParD family antitoxin n=1 Tax=Photorhabdus asymbiotica TaxID=291112 RepID=UPI003DA765BD
MHYGIAYNDSGYRRRITWFCRKLQEKQAESKLKALRQLIDEGDNSGDVVAWVLNIFLTRMKNKTHNIQ